MQSSGKLLRDYHTAQVPGRASLKSCPHASRRDELAIPRHELNTILSTRDFRQDAGYLVAVQARDDSPYSLEALGAALRKPRFVLYLGRKTCPPGAPLHPQIIEAESADQAFDQYLERLTEAIATLDGTARGATLELPAQVERIAWGQGIAVDLAPDLTVTRKDRPLRRRGWQFGDRTENVALIPKEA